MDNVSSTIEIQHPKPEIQLEKTIQSLCIIKIQRILQNQVGILPNYQASYTKNIHQYLLPLFIDHRATMSTHQQKKRKKKKSSLNHTMAMG